MSTIHVPSDQPTIAAAITVATTADLSADSGYVNEDVTVTKDGPFITGDFNNTGIVLRLGAGIETIHIEGGAPWTVFDNSGHNIVTGNGILAGPDGITVVHVSGGNDQADLGVNIGMGAQDTLIVDYSFATRAIVNAAEGTIALSDNFDPA